MGDSPARDFIHGVHDKVFEWPERMAEIRQKVARSLIKVNGIMLFAFGGNKKLNAPIPLKEGAPIGERATAGGKSLVKLREQVRFLPRGCRRGSPNQGSGRPSSRPLSFNTGQTNGFGVLATGREFGLRQRERSDGSISS
jgi:hypothetical protein